MRISKRPPDARILQSSAGDHAWVRHKRFAVVVSQFNPAITNALLAGATKTLRRHGVSPRQITVVRVPGTFELPVACAKLAHAKRWDALVALGAIIRGGTPQYRVIASAVAVGLERVAVTARIPVTFGIIVADTLAQARARAGLPVLPRGRTGRRPRNRGSEAALAALAMVKLFQRIRRGRA